VVVVDIDQSSNTDRKQDEQNSIYIYLNKIQSKQLTVKNIRSKRSLPIQHRRKKTNYKK